MDACVNKLIDRGTVEGKRLETKMFNKPNNVVYQNAVEEKLGDMKDLHGGCASLSRAIHVSQL